MSKKETLSILTLKEVSNFNTGKKGTSVWIKSLHRRQKIFRKHNYNCAECGIHGCYWAVELYKNGRIELNLYAINTDGKEVLMTIDHIKPVSKGGTDGLYNQQAMCATCNNRKGNAYVTPRST